MLSTSEDEPMQNQVKIVAYSTSLIPERIKKNFQEQLGGNLTNFDDLQYYQLKFYEFHNFRCSGVKLFIFFMSFVILVWNSMNFKIFMILAWTI